MRPVILYASAEGQTRLICQQLVSRLLDQDIEVALYDIAQLPDDFDLGVYTHKVLAASIRYGHHQPLMRQFIKRHRSLLDEPSSAFVSVNLTARKAEKNRPETNPYMQKFLRRSGWQPAVQEVFPGALRYSEYNLFNRRVIQLIMRMTGGSTDLGRDIEYTDWPAVDQFGERLAAWIQGRSE